jgi:hypothetical protein
LGLPLTRLLGRGLAVECHAFGIGVQGGAAVDLPRKVKLHTSILGFALSNEAYVVHIERKPSGELEEHGVTQSFLCIAQEQASSAFIPLVLSPHE